MNSNDIKTYAAHNMLHDGSSEPHQVPIGDC